MGRLDWATTIDAQDTAKTVRVWWIFIVVMFDSFVRRTNDANAALRLRILTEEIIRLKPHTVAQPSAPRHYIHLKS